MKLRTKAKIRKVKKRTVVGGCLLVAAGLLLVLANKADSFAEWYSVTIYDRLVSLVGRFFGIFPFSVFEAGVYILIASLLFMLIVEVLKRVAAKVGRRAGGEQRGNGENAGNGKSAGRVDFAGWLFLTASILFFLYAANCGVNYHRVSFAEHIGLVDMEGGNASYSVEELADVCRMLTEDVNESAGMVERDGEGVMVCSEEALQREAVCAMELLSAQYPELEGYYPPPKAFLVPWVLSVQQITGIYSPFTIEANYNGAVTDYNIPFSACHELSHLRGFMQEEEANFIAYLACTQSGSAEFQYSGNLRGWISCMNVLYQADYETWAEIRSGLCALAEADLKANSAFLRRYEGRAADVAEKMNDSYLKANGQTDGVKSYHRMADLIVTYYIRKA